MNENFKKTRLNIIKVKNCSEVLIWTIPVLITIVPPAIKSILTKKNGFEDFCSGPNLVSWIIIIFLLLSYYILWFFKKNIDADKNYTDEEILLWREISTELDNLKRTTSVNSIYLEKSSSITYMLDYTVQNLRKLLYKNQISAIDFKETLSTTLFDIYKTLNNLYVYEREQITIAFYYYNETTNEFFDLESVKPEFYTNRKGRIWAANDDSHICYVARRKIKNEFVKDEFVFNDINNELNTPVNGRDDDCRKYVSSISIPILSSDEKQIRGVFSITSNYQGRFDRKTKGEISIINTIFVDVFYNIAKLIEIVLNKHFIMGDKTILLEILKDYQSKNPKLLNAGHISLVKDLSAIVESKDEH